MTYQWCIMTTLMKLLVLTFNRFRYVNFRINKEAPRNPKGAW